MSNVYEKCPVLENNKFILRLIEEKDAKSLLEVYSDKNALPFFNSDNCNGSNFYNETEENMLEAIKYWLLEYKGKGFVRFSIIDKIDNKAVGTIELFNRKSTDYFNDCGILRLDVKSSYEDNKMLSEILSIIIEPSFELFECTMIATKAPIYAIERIKSLKNAGFIKTEERLAGHNDKHTYGDYWIIRKNDYTEHENI